MLKNDNGADFLPMKLAVVLLAAFIVVTLAVTYTRVLIDESSVVAARSCASKVAGLAAAEYADSCSDTGAGILTGISVPGSVRMITFGTAEPNGMIMDRIGTYTIQYKDGSNETYFTGAPLGADSTGPECGRPLALYPGRYSVHISIRPVNGSMMALIYPEAA